MSASEREKESGSQQLFQYIKLISEWLRTVAVQGNTGVVDDKVDALAVGLL